MQRLVFCAVMAAAAMWLGRMPEGVSADPTESQATAAGLLAVGALADQRPIPPAPQPDPDGDDQGVRPKPAKHKAVVAPRVECDGDSCRVVEDCQACDTCQCSAGECGDGACHSAGSGHAHHAHGGPVRRLAHAWRHRRFRPLQRLFFRGCRGCR